MDDDGVFFLNDFGHGDCPPHYQEPHDEACACGLLHYDDLLIELCILEHVGFVCRHV